MEVVDKNIVRLVSNRLNPLVVWILESGRES